VPCEVTLRLLAHVQILQVAQAHVRAQVAQAHLRLHLLLHLLLQHCLAVVG
jgi:hypothetical protein